jgi:hypothetical protein
MIFQVLTAASIKMTALWYIVPCTLVSSRMFQRCVLRLSLVWCWCWGSKYLWNVRPLPWDYTAQRLRRLSSSYFGMDHYSILPSFSHFVTYGASAGRVTEVYVLRYLLIKWIYLMFNWIREKKWSAISYQLKLTSWIFNKIFDRSFIKLKQEWQCLNKLRQ